MKIYHLKLISVIACLTVLVLVTYLTHRGASSDDRDPVSLDIPPGIETKPPGDLYRIRERALSPETEKHCEDIMELFLTGEVLKDEKQKDVYIICAMLFELSDVYWSLNSESREKVRENARIYLRENADLIAPIIKKQWDKLPQFEKDITLGSACSYVRHMSHEKQGIVLELIKESLKLDKGYGVRLRGTGMAYLTNAAVLQRSGYLSPEEAADIVRPYMHDPHGDVAFEASWYLAQQGEKEALLRLAYLLNEKLRYVSSEEFWREGNDMKYPERFIEGVLQILPALFAEKPARWNWWPEGWIAFIEDNYDNIRWDNEKSLYYLLE